MNIVNCERKIDDINTLFSLVINDRTQIFFDKTNVLKPDFLNKELSFVRLVSWLYTIYFETGKLALGVISGVMDSEIKLAFKNHKSIVSVLRTKLQHNIDKSKSSRDFKIEKDYVEWMKKACGKGIPVDEKDWAECSRFLIGEAEVILSSIKSILEEMSDSDVKRKLFSDNWHVTVTRNVPVHIYDELISNIVNFIDIEEFDTVAYRNKNLDSWRLFISNLSPNANFKHEIERIVGSCLFKDFYYVLPVTIDELYQHFYLTRDLLNKIRNFIIDDPSLCDLNCDELLILLQSNFSDSRRK